MLNSKRILIILSTLTSALCLSSFAVSALTLPSISRSKAEKRALKIINLSWEYDSSKNGKIDTKYSDDVLLPQQFQGIDKVETKGIPYNWGGMDGVDTHSYNTPWTNFLDAVSKGAFTGNVVTTSKLGYISGTAGMDCSGFVQSVFNITSTRLTSSNILGNYFEKIDLDDIKHMDILDKPGSHVAIFDKWGTLNGVDGAYTYESTPDQTYGGIQGTKKYFMSLKYLTQKGYLAGRYINLTDSNDSQSAPTSGKFSIGGYAIVSNVEDCADLVSTSDKTSAILTTIPKDTALYLVSYSNGYYKVTFNNTIGWVKESVLASVPKNKYVTVTGVSGLNIRTTASTKSQIIGTLSENQCAEVLAKSKDGYWYQISINGITGWCYVNYLTFLN